MFALPTIDHRMTLDEFLEWIETQESRHYLWDGEVFPVHPPDESQKAAAMAGASARHARVMMRALFALETALRGRGCTTYSGDLGVLLSTTGRYVFPDLSVVCGAPEFADASQRVLTNTTLVLEVLSPSTEAFDCGSKATAYRRLPSLKALVLVSQDRLAAEIYRREGARWTVEDAPGSTRPCRCSAPTWRWRTSTTESSFPSVSARRGSAEPSPRRRPTRARGSPRRA